MRIHDYGWYVRVIFKRKILWMPLPRNNEQFKKLFCFYRLGYIDIFYCGVMKLSFTNTLEDYNSWRVITHNYKKSKRDKIQQHQISLRYIKRMLEVNFENI